MNKKFSHVFSLRLRWYSFWVIIAFLSLSLLTGAVVLFFTASDISKKAAEAKEAARPAEIEIITLQDENCKDCYRVSSLVESIKKKNVNVQSEKTLDISSQEAQGFISKFSITAVPTIIVSGEIEKDESLKELWKNLGTVEDGTFVLRNVGAPYVLVESGDVRGRVDFTILSDSSCKECYSAEAHKSILSRFGIIPKTVKTYDTSSQEGRELIKKYSIQFVPTILLAGDVEVYTALGQVWKTVGTIEDDKAYVFRNGVSQMGVYKDLKTGKIINPTPQTEKKTEAQPSNSKSKLVVEKDVFDFGTVKQSDGISTRTLELKNGGTEPLIISSLVTSCMCTSASVVYDGVEGPVFGMPGHGKGNPTDWSVSIAPGKTAQLKIAYDPNAHGKQTEESLSITRVVTILSNDPANPKKEIKIQVEQKP